MAKLIIDIKTDLGPRGELLTRLTSDHPKAKADPNKVKKLASDNGFMIHPGMNLTPATQQFNEMWPLYADVWISKTTDPKDKLFPPMLCRCRKK